MDDQLLPWLRAAIAETEKDARDAITARGGDEWAVEVDPRGDSWWRDPWDPSVIAGGKPIATCDEEYGGRLVADHIARNDPRTVLAQCEAHTAILAIHNVWDVVFPGDTVDIDPHDRHCVGCGFDALENERTPDVNDCPTLRAVALAYQHQPGYREEWKP